ncbi:MAG: hypothetical protein IJU93_05400 [Lachnospiraceae bacterium]|nr:hypothetical protein [Lachnospiraceae bacterium]
MLLAAAMLFTMNTPVYADNKVPIQEVEEEQELNSDQEEPGGEDVGQKLDTEQEEPAGEEAENESDGEEAPVFGVMSIADDDNVSLNKITIDNLKDIYGYQLTGAGGDLGEGDAAVFDQITAKTGDDGVTYTHDFYITLLKDQGYKFNVTSSGGKFYKDKCTEALNGEEFAENAKHEGGGIFLTLSGNALSNGAAASNVSVGLNAENGASVVAKINLQDSGWDNTLLHHTDKAIEQYDGKLSVVDGTKAFVHESKDNEEILVPADKYKAVSIGGFSYDYIMVSSETGIDNDFVSTSGYDYGLIGFKTDGLEGVGNNEEPIAKDFFPIISSNDGYTKKVSLIQADSSNYSGLDEGYVYCSANEAGKTEYAFLGTSGSGDSEKKYLGTIRFEVKDTPSSYPSAENVGESDMMTVQTIESEESKDDYELRLFKEDRGKLTVSGEDGPVRLEESKLYWGFHGLEENTEYYLASRRVNNEHRGKEGYYNNGVVYLPSAWNFNPETITTGADSEDEEEGYIDTSLEEIGRKTADATVEIENKDQIGEKLPVFRSDEIVSGYDYSVSACFIRVADGVYDDDEFEEIPANKWKFLEYDGDKDDLEENWNTDKQVELEYEFDDEDLLTPGTDYYYYCWVTDGEGKTLFAERFFFATALRYELSIRASGNTINYRTGDIGDYIEPDLKVVLADDTKLSYENIKVESDGPDSSDRYPFDQQMYMDKYDWKPTAVSSKAFEEGTHEYLNGDEYIGLDYNYCKDGVVRLASEVVAVNITDASTGRILMDWVNLNNRSDGWTIGDMKEYSQKHGNGGKIGSDYDEYLDNNEIVPMEMEKPEDGDISIRDFNLGDFLKKKGYTYDDIRGMQIQINVAVAGEDMDYYFGDSSTEASTYEGFSVMSADSELKAQSEGPTRTTREDNPEAFSSATFKVEPTTMELIPLDAEIKSSDHKVRSGDITVSLNLGSVSIDGLTDEEIEKLTSVSVDLTDSAQAAALLVDGSVLDMSKAYQPGEHSLTIKDTEPFLELEELEKIKTFLSSTSGDGIELIPEGAGSLYVEPSSEDEKGELAGSARKDEIYYDAYSLWKEDDFVKGGSFRDSINNYIKVSLGDMDVTTFKNISYKFAGALSGNNVKWSETAPTLNAGATLYISACYVPQGSEGEDGNKYITPVGVKIAQQPITLKAVGDEAGIAVTSVVGKELDDRFVLGNKYSGKITVSACDTGTDLPLVGEYKGEKSVKTDINSWLKLNSLSIDAAGSSLDKINTSFPGSYPIVFAVSQADILDTLSTNYVLEGSTGGYLKIEDGIIVSFYRADNGEKVSANQSLAYGADNFSSIEIVSADNITEEIKNWTLVTNQTVGAGIPVAKSATSDKYPYLKWSKSDENGIYGTYKFDLSDFANNEGIKTIALYAAFSDQAETIGKSNPTNTKTGVTVSVGNISPVVYTGNKIYVSDDTKAFASKGNAKKGIDALVDLNIWNADTGAKLSIGTDYTLSYKNNVNAAKSTDNKKPPTIVLKGKGDYKGITLNLPFTILPADIEALAEVRSGKSRYVKYGKKGFDPKYQVYFKDTKKKLNKKTFELVYYNEYGIKVDPADYTSQIENVATKFFITAKAVADKNGNTNYMGETTFDVSDPYDNAIAYGIPAKSKSLKVKMAAVKADFAENKKPGDVFKLSEITGPDKESLSTSDYTVRYFNEALTDEITDDAISAGTIYVSVELNSLEKMQQLKVFQPALVKLTVKGTKVSGIKLSRKVFYANDTTRATFELPQKVSEKKYLEWSLDRQNWTNMAQANSFDGHSAGIGVHQVYVRGLGGYMGTQIINFNVKAGKIDKNSKVEVIVNNNKPVPLNLAGYYSQLADQVSVKVDGKALALYDDYSLTFPSLTKPGQGKVKITFVNAYSGSYEAGFNVTTGSLGSGGNVVVNELSCLSTDTLPAVEVYQMDYTPVLRKGSSGNGLYPASWKSKKVELKNRKHYTLEAVNSGTQNPVRSIRGTLKGDGKLFTGSSSVTSWTYAREKQIKNIEVTAVSGGTYSDGSTSGSLSACTINKKHYAKYVGDLDEDGSSAYVCPAVYAVKVSYADKTTADFTGFNEVNRYFNIRYENNQSISSKAGIAVSAKNSSSLIGGPSAREYITTFSIVGEGSYPGSI